MVDVQDALNRLFEEVVALRADIARLERKLDESREPQGTLSSASASFDALIDVVEAASAPSSPQCNPEVSAITAIEVLLEQMFRAALLDTKEAAWECLAALTFSGDLKAPKALDNLKAFSWKKLRANATRYLSESRPDSFVVDRVVALETGTGDERVKVFLHCPGASAAPVTLRRDPAAEGHWRLNQVSL